MTDDEDEVLTTTALIRYEWDCPACQETNEVPYGADFGTELCDSCGAEVEVTT